MFSGRYRSVPNQTQSPFLNEQSSRFVVNGSALPLVDFDVGESYAGLLPIGDDTGSQLYFWFFPSTNPLAYQNKEILIYLTGGPGCSSIGELLQLNGPISWPPGAFQPIPNRWSWHRLTNVVWIDQPLGTGFSRGAPTAINEEDVAQQFLGFWQNFVQTFALQGYQVHVTGSSYAGMYAPYISSAMLDRNNTTYFNISGMAIWDGLYSKLPLAEDIPTARFIEKWKTVLPFNDTFRAGLKLVDQRCGFTAYLDEFLVFPPKGQQPSILPGEDPATGMVRPECAIFVAAFTEARQFNPCLNLFDVTSRCPLPFDPIGFAAGRFILPSSFDTPYFNLPAVKAALNAPLNATWAFCPPLFANPVFATGVDASIKSGPGSQPVIPRVIDGTRNVILGHGSRDFLVLPDATLLTIQNLTWQGVRGFRVRPWAPLFVPYHDNTNASAGPAGAGVVGTSHSERGLTWFETALAGHLVAQDQPAVAFRMVEVLLGRVQGFTSTAPFTVDVGGAGPQPPAGALGMGTVDVRGTVGWKWK
ncbi:hypothetical protein C7999DRAFT_39627 [Corynascus novoguineensis]|uniref:Serine carboxypeptidase n=1 Tax=Corynascus novoguineensis TaxID=1126955 RepID=A0AAN7HGR3_9PEZI|nr:hypothetical protein C7999DRAFT_39627 [Corynascus novoguineensis]